MSKHVIPVFGTIKTLAGLSESYSKLRNITVANTLQLMCDENLLLDPEDFDNLSDFTGDVNFFIADSSENVEDILNVLDEVGINSAEPLSVHGGEDYTGPMSSEDVELFAQDVHQQSVERNAIRTMDVVNRLKQYDLDDVLFEEDITTEMVNLIGTNLLDILPEETPLCTIAYNACDMASMAEGLTPFHMLSGEATSEDHFSVSSIVRIKMSPEDEPDGKVSVIVDPEGACALLFSPEGISMIEGMRPGIMTLIHAKSEGVTRISVWVVSYDGFYGVDPVTAEIFTEKYNPNIGTIVQGEDVVFVHPEDYPASRVPFFKTAVSQDMANYIAQKIIDEGQEME